MKLGQLNVKNSMLNNVNLKNKYKDDNDLQIKMVSLKMEKNSSCFKMSIMLFRKIMTYFRGIIDIERYNGCKKWMITSRRMSKSINKVDKIMRIFINSPNMNDNEQRKKWSVAAAIQWSQQDRQH